MDVSFLNSPEEMLGCLFLAGSTLFVCGYAIFLSYAIYDYQTEKPNEEKSLMDLFVKDLMHSQFWLLCYIGLTFSVSLFTPPISSTIAYLLTYICIFLVSFHQMSIFVLLFIQHLFVFQNDKFSNVDNSKLRWASNIWKLVLTLISLFLSCFIKSPEVPTLFKMLTKGENYER